MTPSFLRHKLLEATCYLLISGSLTACRDVAKIPRELKAMTAVQELWWEFAEFTPNANALVFTNKIGLQIGVATFSAMSKTGAWIGASQGAGDLYANFFITDRRVVAGGAWGFPVSGGRRTNVCVYVNSGPPYDFVPAVIHMGMVVSNYSTGVEDLIGAMDFNCDFEWDLKGTNECMVLRVSGRWLPLVGMSREGFSCLEDGRTNLYRWNGSLFERVSSE
jgi:hypothetical protein